MIILPRTYATVPILFVIKLDNKRCTSVCNALYTEAKVECEYLKALDDSMIPVW